MSLDEQAIHLEFLARAVLNRPAVLRAFEVLDAYDDQKLAWLLRHHSPKKKGAPIRDATEIQLRDDFDFLLGAFSELAVALVAAYVPAKFPPALETKVTTTLGRPPLRVYYEDHYPVMLPSLLRLHCEGAIQLPRETAVNEAWNGFEWFRRFAGRFRDDTDLHAFLWLLDSGSLDGITLPDFLKFLGDPKRALAGVVKLSGDREPPEAAAMGMIRFFEFCLELSTWLRNAQAATPLLASAVWFYYAYWFREFQHGVGTESQKCLDLMMSWTKSLSAPHRKAALETRKQLEAALLDLTGPEYATLLVRSTT